MTAPEVLCLAALSVAVASCSVKLPEPESPGARLYASRCGGCHRLFPPTSLKYEMWKVQVERMQGEMARRGVPPLEEGQKAVLLDYLKRHSG